MSDRIPVLPQYVLPKQALTSFAGWVAGKERGAVTTWIVRRFVAKYGVDMSEAADPDTARLATDLRPAGGDRLEELVRSLTGPSAGAPAGDHPAAPQIQETRA